MDKKEKTIVAFDPQKHKELQLLELTSQKVGDIISFILTPADVDFEIASLVPWYYFVEVV